MATELKEMKSMMFDDLALEIKYFVNTDSGKVRYSSEIIFSSGDKVIIDDKTLSRLKNKIKAYSYITKNFVEGLNRDQWVAKMKRLVEYAGLKVIESKFLSMSVDGDRATVKVFQITKDVVGYGQGVDVYTLVREGGVWKIDGKETLENVL